MQKPKLGEKKRTADYILFRCCKKSRNQPNRVNICLKKKRMPC